MSRGFDYGRGLCNIDHETGIRFGVIPANDLGESWYESSEADYGPAGCGKCGNEAVAIDEVPFDLDDCPSLRQEGDHEWSYRKHDVLAIPEEFRAECNDHEEWADAGRDFACLHCARSFDSEDAYSDEAIGGFNLDDGEYVAHQGHDDCDIFVIKSPYYTHGPFCSPCAPGAVYIRNGSEDGEKAYCFAPDWFDPANGDDVTGEYCGEETTCPYPVFRVADDVCVFSPNQAENDE